MSCGTFFPLYGNGIASRYESIHLGLAVDRPKAFHNRRFIAAEKRGIDAKPARRLGHHLRQLSTANDANAGVHDASGVVGTPSVWRCR
jgi:hypothetical protein